MRFGELRQAVRSLARRPAFAVTAILTISLGIGANIAVYRVIYSVLIRPLPFREPAQLMQLWEATPILPQLPASVPDFEDWRAQTRSFSDVAAYTFQAMNHVTLLGQGEPDMVSVTNATANLFSMMGIQPLTGRPFTAADERSKSAVGLISEKLWRRKFNADPAVRGKLMRLETISFTIVGVLPDRQAFPVWADVWIPFSWIEPQLKDTRKFHPLEVIARLKPDISESQAQAEMQSFAARLAMDHPDTNANVRASLLPLSRQITGEVRPALMLVWCAVGLVLLMACVNLAHMVLARILERRNELALRMALGARTSRLVQLVITESLVIAAAGGLAGVALAAAASGVLGRLAEIQIPHMDWPTYPVAVWLFATGATFVCGVLFALPACREVRRVETSVESTRTIAKGRSGASAWMVGGEVAVAFVVLTGAVLVMRSFTALLNQDAGFQAKGVLAIEVPLPSSRYDWSHAAEFFDSRLGPALGSLPGVTAVAAANCAPMSLGPAEHSRFATRFGVEGHTFPPGRYPVAQLRWVTPDYFRALGIPLKRGRWLTASDANQPRYLINETLARRFFPEQDPTRRRLMMNVVDPHPEFDEIAGVVGDVRDLGLDEEPAPTLYLIATSPGLTVLMKTNGDSASLASAAREAIRSADPEIAVTRIRPLTDYVAASLARRRFPMALLGAFGVLAALLTAGGMYGLLSYSASGRLREFGIRAALGASPRKLLLMLLREGAIVAIPGIVIGVLLWFSFVRLIGGLLYQLSPADPLSITAVTLFLLVVTMASVWLPAKRAASVDPGTALRAD